MNICFVSFLFRISGLKHCCSSFSYIKIKIYSAFPHFMLLRMPGALDAALSGFIKHMKTYCTFVKTYFKIINSDIWQQVVAQVWLTLKTFS